MVVTHPHELPAQEPERPNIEELEFAELEFVPPEALQYTLEPGVDVFFLEDHTLPLVSVYARFRGGPRHFSRDELGAATAVPILLRSGGTTELPPDSVDKLLEFYAAETTFGGGGGTSFSSVNMLTRHLGDVLAIWGDLLKNPAFDPAPVEVWRGQELEDVRRKQDTPGRLAISKFNRLLFGDHPVGWELGAEDLEPEDLTAEALKSIHRRIYCLDNLTLGVTGDVTWEEMRPKLEAGLADWSPCSAPLSEPSPSNTVVEPGVYLVPRELEQSTVVIGRPSGVRLADDPEYFSSRIGNSILGASGLHEPSRDASPHQGRSRILGRLGLDRPDELGGDRRRHHADEKRIDRGNYPPDPRRTPGDVHGSPGRHRGKGRHRPHRERVRLQLPELGADRLPADAVCHSRPPLGLAGAVLGRDPGCDGRGSRDRVPEAPPTPRNG